MENITFFLIVKTVTILENGSLSARKVRIKQNSKYQQFFGTV